MLKYLDNSGGIYSYGYINSNGTNFEINDGILLTTGNVDNALELIRIFKVMEIELAGLAILI
jgi:hypothetical protein